MLFKGRLIMYNSRTKSTLCPAALPEDLKISPPPISGCSKKKYIEFYFHVLAVGEFYNHSAIWNIFFTMNYQLQTINCIHPPQHRTA